jgi:hypothetical protein
MSNGMITLFVTESEKEFRVYLREPVVRPASMKTLTVPKTAAYLLLAAQASSDALQDSLENMYEKAEGDTLRWEDVAGKNTRWDNEGFEGERQNINVTGGET